MHIIGVIAWLAGLLYLPRLFVYHAAVEPGSAQSETFKVMERRLLGAIMNPALAVSLVTGGLLIANLGGEAWASGWLLAKLVCVLGLFAMHGLMARWRRDFAADRNERSQIFYRVANEVPTVLMIGIVVFAVVRPF